MMQPCNLNPGVRGNGLLLKSNLLPKGCLSLKCSLYIICLASTYGYTEIELSFVFNCRRLLCVDAYSTSTYRNWLVSPLARRGVNLPGSNLLCLMFSATSTTFGILITLCLSNFLLTTRLLIGLTHIFSTKIVPQTARLWIPEDVFLTT